MQQMIGKMARMYSMFILLGFMIVIIAFFVGYSNSQTAATYFAETKLVRETTLMTERASMESIGQWLPYFKFLGLGLILGGIVMALRVIIDNLKAAGEQVMSNLPTEKRPPMPKPPWFGPLMPMVMMVGLLIFIIALVIGFQNASVASKVFSNSLPVIDEAAAGSTLLGQLESIHSTSAWLIPFKFFGIATEFLAIVMGLATIITILTNQTEMIKKGIHVARGN
ncbi:MAG: hypothetical protein FVQ83_06390 [Chloroflexi bacterium]|nr:hypothetical protein [Chloroflexota bacterium]